MMKRALLSALTAAWLSAGGASVALAWPAEVTEEIAIREGPGMEYPFIVVVPDGTIVDVLRCYPRSEWCRIAYEDVDGFARRRFLDRVGDVYVGPRLDLYWDILPRYRRPDHPRYVARPPYNGPGPGYGPRSGPGEYRREGRPMAPGSAPPGNRPDAGGPPGQRPQGQAPQGQVPRGQGQGPIGQGAAGQPQRGQGPLAGPPGQNAPGQAPQGQPPQRQAPTGRPPGQQGEQGGAQPGAPGAPGTMPMPPLGR